MEEKETPPARKYRGPSAEHIATIAEKVGLANHFAPPEQDPWGHIPLMTLDHIWCVLRPETDGARSPLENRALSAYLRSSTTKGRRAGKVSFRLRPLREFEPPGVRWPTDDPLTRRLAEVVIVDRSLPLRCWTSTRDIYAATAPGVALNHAEKCVIGRWLSDNGAACARRHSGLTRFWSVSLLESQGPKEGY